MPKYMMVLRTGEAFGAGPPPEALSDELGKLVAESTTNGWLISAGRLRHSSHGAIVRLAKGHLSIIDGPFTEAKEVIGGFAIIEADSKEQAIARVRRFMEIHRDTWAGWEGESEIRELLEPGQPPG